MMRILLFTCILAEALAVEAQPLHGTRSFTYGDSLRGSNGPYRAWWDVTHYDVTVRPDFTTRSLVGTTTISIRVLQPGERLQIDLQQPLIVDAVFFDGFPDMPLRTMREDNVLWVELGGRTDPGERIALTIAYHGVPRAAKNPPWDGGWVWKTDAHGNPWMSVACQGLGASVWYPCKDIQSDEPDSAALHITAPDSLQAVGNGRLRGTRKNADGTTTWDWAVTSPINNYDLAVYIGKYTHFSDVFPGSKGPLDLDYWVVPDNEEKAREHFKEVPRMLACYESWFGPFPWYADGFKLVEAPFYGMEHQSAVAYGNHYMAGYLNKDRSGTGWGLKWDYVIVHEGAHEWFGNSITTADLADMWIHEGFADYAEAVFTECSFGTEAATDYVVGLRRSIANDKPLIGAYGVNQEGSGDMYNKGSNLLHTIRQIVGDSVFKAMLLEMNRRFYHSIVTSAQVEYSISMFTHHDLAKVFDQYLRTTRVPALQWTVRKGDLFVRWTNCVDGFNMPLRIRVNGEERTIPVTTAWSWPAQGLGRTAELRTDRAWYVTDEEADPSMLSKEEVKAIKAKASIAGAPHF